MHLGVVHEPHGVALHAGCAQQIAVERTQGAEGLAHGAGIGAALHFVHHPTAHHVLIEGVPVEALVL